MFKFASIIFLCRKFIENIIFSIDLLSQIYYFYLLA